MSGADDATATPASAPAPGRANRGRVTTAYLLTCAAIGVATGVLVIPATALSTALYLTAPPLSALTYAAWVIGYVLAMRLIERPGAALLTGLISGIVAMPLSASGPAIIITNLMFAAIVELPFLLTLYRRWSAGLLYTGSIAGAVLYSAWTVLAADMTAFPVWVLVAYVVATLASATLGAWLGILIADRLRNAGVAKVARHRGHAAPRGA